MLRPESVSYIVVHCSATPLGMDCGAKEIDAWHKGQGWSCIGYHYVVRLDGTVECGRPIYQVGAHVSGYNHCSVGVCYIGGIGRDGKPADTRTASQKTALLRVLRELRVRYPNAVIVGHNFLNPKKACPCFDARLEYLSL